MPISLTHIERNKYIDHLIESKTRDTQNLQNQQSALKNTLYIQQNKIQELKNAPIPNGSVAIKARMQEINIIDQSIKTLKTDIQSLQSEINKHISEIEQLQKSK